MKKSCSMFILLSLVLPMIVTTQNITSAAGTAEMDDFASLAATLSHQLDELSKSTARNPEMDNLNSLVAMLRQQLDELSRLSLLMANHQTINVRSQAQIMQQLSEEMNIIRTSIGDAKTLSYDALMKRLNMALSYISKVITRFQKLESRMITSDPAA